uniref:Uncharacterized protein n=1 Tax=Rhizophora mucronata TaxID=61149 RepID=A0A2P2PS63_RHIMU
MVSSELPPGAPGGVTE